MTPLASRIKEMIRTNGPMSLAHYMALCLGDQQHGYYMRRDPLGMQGDFTTAPEISQMFGEMIGFWMVHMWQDMGQPDAFQLIELGPGRGTLMADLLRAASICPDFLAAVSVHMVETSPVLKDRQRDTLAASGQSVTWHTHIDDVPAGPSLIIGNEFFDALPIRQYEKQDQRWHERVIGLDDDDKLIFGLGPGKLDEQEVPDHVRLAKDGAILERSPASEGIMACLAARLAEQGGAALLIDYGYGKADIGDTFQAIHAHDYIDPLDMPGDADLTAHVNFESLGTIARAHGLVCPPLMEQGTFLLGLGLQARADQLCRGKTADQITAIQSALHRLTAPDQMGSLFKVLGVAAPGLIMPPFAPSPAPPAAS